MPFFTNPFADEIAPKPERKFLKPSMDVDIAADNLVPNEFYFEIRLCEMYLRKSAEAGRAFVPRLLAITQCLYNRKELTLPMAVGQNILDQVEAQTGKSGEDKVISFSNLRLAGPMPYCGLDIGFFGGLYRVERGNWADSAFDLVADLTSALSVDVSRYVDMGRRLVVNLTSLLGVQSDDWRFGHYVPMYKEDDEFFDRYLVMVGADDTPFDWANIEVRQEDSLETLCINDGSVGKPFSGRDFAVFRLRSRRTRGDYKRFKFDELFEDARKLRDDPDRFKWARLQLLQEISDSPDLTETHKLKLMTTYLLKLEEWAQVTGLHRGPETRGVNDRIKSKIGILASTAQRKGLPRETVTSFHEISTSWEQLSKLPIIVNEGAPSEEETDAFLLDPVMKPLLKGKAADFVDTIKAQSFEAEN